MKQTAIAVKPGNWVRITPLWPGIWKVYRVLSGFKEDEWALDVPLKSSKRTLVFCHRLVNDSWKRSFAHQSCELSYLRPVDSDDRERLDALMSDSKLHKAFEQYQAKQNRIDFIANIGFGGLSKEVHADFVKLCDKIFAVHIGEGLTIAQVLEMLREHGLEKNRHELPQQVTLQLTSIDHELRGDEFVHKKYRVLPF